jgi:UDP-N-acetylmuramoyl-L-alanine---L-glutamate ligase
MNNSKVLSKLFRGEFEQYSQIGVLGFGREGRTTYAMLRKFLPKKKIVIADKNHDVRNDKSLKDDSLATVLTGDNYLSIIEDIEIVFVSPGIPLFGIELPTKLRLTSQTDFIFRHFGEKIIAVTGTKGKSTTSSLITHILQGVYPQTPLAGNIGIPPFNVLDELIEVPYAVFEVSSHQLQYVAAAPRFAVLLNLFPEHLDYYPDVTTYYSMKNRLYACQKPSDVAVVNLDDKNIVDAKKYEVSGADLQFYSLQPHSKQGAWVENNMMYFRNRVGKSGQVIDTQFLSLKGLHNVSNCMAAVCVAYSLQVSDELLKERMKSFVGLPHRMEFVGEFDKKLFYNDSIATIPEASLAAIETMPQISTIILGGFDRGVSYTAFLERLSEKSIDGICFYGQAGKRMLKELEKIGRQENVWFDELFADAVNKAIQLTKQGGICLLSPAAASYDQFRDFEERGDVFKEIVGCHF